MHSPYNANPENSRRARIIHERFFHPFVAFARGSRPLHGDA
jgi:hypothetical protein